MVQESFIAPTPLEAYKLAVQKYGSIENFKVIKASQYKNSKNELVAQIEIEVSQELFAKHMGLDEEEMLIEELAMLKAKMNTMKEALLPQEQQKSFAKGHDSIKEIKDLLMQKGLSSEWVQQMLDPFVGTQVADDSSLLLSFILEEIEESINISEDITKNRVNLFVGPTGVGKTTSIAKIVAWSILKGIEPNDIAIVNLDNFRVGANEQLGYYAKRMGVDYYYAYNDTVVQELMQSLSSKEHIFIDSAGSAPYDLKKLLDTVAFYKDTTITLGKSSTNLVVSAGVKYSDLKDIYEHFSFLNISSLIITKIDETRDIGNIIAFLLETSLPVSFISTGQEVPKDLEVAKKQKLLEYFIGQLKDK